MAMRSVETDYLVVGAGAMGMAFTDALILQVPTGGTGNAALFRSGSLWALARINDNLAIIGNDQLSPPGTA